MKTSESIKEIAAALASAQAKFHLVGKSGSNAAQGYAYAALDDYIVATRAHMAEHGLAITSTVVAIADLEPRATRGGAVLYVRRATVITRLIHSSGEWIEAEAYGEGMDSGDKAVYKAITGARKYGVASLLGLATTDDPEVDDPPESAPADPAPPPPQSPPPNAVFSALAKWQIDPEQIRARWGHESIWDAATVQALRRFRDVLQAAGDDEQKLAEAKGVLRG